MCQSSEHTSPEILCTSNFAYPCAHAKFWGFPNTGRFLTGDGWERGCGVGLGRVGWGGANFRCAERPFIIAYRLQSLSLLTNVSLRREQIFWVSLCIQNKLFISTLVLCEISYFPFFCASLRTRAYTHECAHALTLARTQIVQLS